MTDCLLGEPLYLLDGPVNGLFLCHTGDGYTGYVPAENLIRLSRAPWIRYLAGPMVLMTRDRVVHPDLTLPIGASLKGVGKTTSRLTIELPDGRRLSIPSCCGKWVAAKPPPVVDRILREARRLLGAPYFWGGKTRLGIDCSGLVQTAFATQGIALPRDSNQQVLAGRLVGTRWSTALLRPGDTMYFLGFHGKIAHTAIYLGGGRYIEAVRPAVRISRLAPDPVHAKTGRSGYFAFAKRVLQ